MHKREGYPKIFHAIFNFNSLQAGHLLQGLFFYKLRMDELNMSQIVQLLHRGRLYIHFLEILCYGAQRIRYWGISDF